MSQVVGDNTSTDEKRHIVAIEVAGSSLLGDIVTITHEHGSLDIFARSIVQDVDPRQIAHFQRRRREMRVLDGEHYEDLWGGTVQQCMSMAWVGQHFARKRLDSVKVSRGKLLTSHACGHACVSRLPNDFARSCRTSSSSGRSRTQILWDRQHLPRFLLTRRE